MTEKSLDNVRLSLEEARTAARDWATQENLAMLDEMGDDEIGRQIVADADVAPELTDEWFENARLVTPLKSRDAA